MSLRRRLIGVAALAGAGLVLSPVLPSFSEPPATTAAALVPNEAAARPPVSTAKPVFTPKQPLSVGVPADLAAAANQFMSTDPAMLAMLQGATYTVVKEGQWTRNSGTVLGVAREIVLAKKIDTPMRQWPVITWDDGTDTYQRHLYNVAYQGVTSYTVLIDRTGGVVDVQPDAGATWVEGPGNDWITTIPKEGD